MKCKRSMKPSNPVLCNPCSLMWKGDRTLGSNSKFKRKERGPKITFGTIERELNQLASAYERKRLQRISRIPQEVNECVEEQPCCKSRTSSVDYFYDQFLTNLDKDMKLRRKIVMSCKSRALAKKETCSQANCLVCKPACFNVSKQEDSRDSCDNNPWQEIIERCRGSRQYEEKRKFGNKRPSFRGKPQGKLSMNCNQLQSRNRYQGHQLLSNQKQGYLNLSFFGKKISRKLCGEILENYRISNTMKHEFLHSNRTALQNGSQGSHSKSTFIKKQTNILPNIFKPTQ